MKSRDLSVSEAARRLNVGLGWIYDLVQAGQLKAEKKDGKWWISAEAVEDRLKQRAEAE